MKSLASALLVAVLCTGCASRDPGCVSAATPDAAEAGWQILLAGGNAADAAVATAFTLAVTEPAGSGLGGQSVVLLMRPHHDPIVLDGSSFAPRGMPTTYPVDSALTGRRAATVPTTVKTLYALWRDYGSGRVSWEECLAPAIDAAENGFELQEFGARSREATHDALLADSLAAITILGSTHIRQPLLATTLQEIAEDPASFYSGRIAKEIAHDMAAHDGWISREDLARVPEPRVHRALHLRYGELDVFSLPPPYGGWVVLQALAELQRAGSEQRPDDALIDALFLAHRERQLRPVFGMSIDDIQAQHDNAAANGRSSGEGGETTHLSVADGDGMMVGISQSVNYYFGCKVMHPTLGFFYNDYMREFVRTEVGHPYALRPGAQPYSSMSATIAARDGVPEMLLGSPGSARIISAVVQVLHNVYGRGRSLGEAVSDSRIHVHPDSSVYFEAEEHRRNFSGAISFPCRLPFPPQDILINDRNPWFGGVHAVMRVRNEYIGTADPRRDGAVRPVAAWDR